MRKSLCWNAFIIIFVIGCSPIDRSGWETSGQAQEIANRAGQELQQLESGKFPIARKVIVTAGPISQPYEVLGEVHVSTVGMVNLGSYMRDALFRSPFSVAAAGATPTASIETMHGMLREQARVQYGSKADAVVNVTYYTEPDGDVFASGLAVHFL